MNIIMDIKELAIKYTREEFIKEASTNESNLHCPFVYDLSSKCCGKEYSKEECMECWGEATKDIKFKGEEETFEVECIDAENRKELTKGQIYLAKQSEFYTNYYEIDGHTYKKERFKLVNELCVEGEKVEEVIKVRCIKEMNFKDITEGKEYTVVEEEPQGYKIINDAESIRRYHKDLFEKVTDDVLMVECIESQEGITLKKKYPLIAEEKGRYFIKNDFGNRTGYFKGNFKRVEPQKEEKKEYTFKEVIENIKDGEIYKYSDTIIKQVDGAISVGKEKAFSDGETLGFWFYNMYKFTKVEEPKPVTTSEAMKALEDGKVVESCRGYQYKKEGEKISLFNKRRCASKSIEFEELENQWIILE